MSRLTLRATRGSKTTLGCPGGPDVVIDGSPDVGGRLLCLAAVGCYANALFAEATRRGIWVRSIEVDAELEWVEHPARARDVRLCVRVEADADEPTIMELVEHADRVNEVANALRLSVPVRVADASVKALQ